MDSNNLKQLLVQNLKLDTAIHYNESNGIQYLIINIRYDGSLLTSTKVPIQSFRDLHDYSGPAPTHKKTLL